MIKKIPVSVGILTFNSARTLKRALESIKMCDDIIICDGGSTDETLSLAHEYGARIIEQGATFKRVDGRLADYSGVRNQCLAVARHPYFLYIDSDEAASPELIETLTRIATSGIEDGYRIPIRMWIGERMIEHSSNYPGYQYRIVRTDRGILFKKPVHERPVFTNTIDVNRTTLDAPWHVYLEQDYIERYMERNWKFVEIERERHADMGLVRFLFAVVPRNLRSATGVILRTIHDRARYPWSTCMPLSVEWGRVRYHLALITVIGANIRHL
ncbi:MAG: putative glycosyl transferase [Parcubacteria group bacterium Greene0714_7]|nr:MAG: putative glycosyl transferase [Parcubacteria group bacterium Greene0714_7]